MEKKVLLIALLLFSLACYAKEVTVDQVIEKTNNELYLLSHGERFLLDKTKILIKPKKSIESLKTDIKQVSKTKSGYIIAIVPEGYDVIEYVEKLRSTKEFETVEYLGGGRIYFTPNDQEMPNVSSNYNYYNNIHAYNAWDITTGNPNIKVAILDTGFQRDHEDLGYGNGNNNYSNVSYSLGYDYYNNTSYNNPIDNHGSMVAGIIGAKANNGIGIAGITGGNFNKGVTMISYRLAYYYNGDEFVLSEEMGNAIIQAVNDGADVINICLGISENSDTNSAIEYAYNHGVPIICAAGKANSTQVPYPASHPKTIAVGGIDNFNIAFTELGIGLDIVAPGSLITSTTASSYGSDSGTSYAAPFVSGTVALMLSMNPSLTPTQIQNILNHTATKVSGYTYNSYGWNSEVGYGMLNTFAAVLAACNPTIIEDTTLCYGSSATFSLNNLPSGLTVQWSITDGYGPSTPTIQTSGNSCTITNNLSMTFSGKLNAKVYKSGNLIATLTKNLILYSDFYGQYTSGNLSGTIDYTHIFYVKPGYNTVISSPHLIGATASYGSSGTTPLYFSLDSTLGKLQFTMPTNNNGIPVWINIGDVCGNQLQLYAISQNSYYLNISYDGCNINISLNEEGDALRSHSIDQPWSYEIRSATRGDLITSGIVNSCSTTISTIGWPKGIYIIKATIGKEETTEKIIVK